MIKSLLLLCLLAVYLSESIDTSNGRKMDTIEQQQQHSLDDDYKRHDLYENDLHSENEKLIRSIDGLLPIGTIAGASDLQTLFSQLTPLLQTVSVIERSVLGLVTNDVTGVVAILQGVLNSVDNLLTNLLALLLNLLAALLNLLGHLLGCTNNLTTIVTQLQQVASQLSVLDAVINLGGTVDDITSQLGTVIGQIEVIIVNLGQVELNEPLLTAVSSLKNSLNALTSHLNSLKDVLSAATTIITTLLNNITSALASINALVRDVVFDVNSLVQIGDLNTGILNLNGLLSDLLDTVNQTVDETLLDQLNELGGILTDIKIQCSGQSGVEVTALVGNIEAYLQLLLRLTGK